MKIITTAYENELMEKARAKEILMEYMYLAQLASTPPNKVKLTMKQKQENKATLDYNLNKVIKGQEMDF